MTEAGVLTGARVTHRTGSVDDLADASPESQRGAVTDLLALPDVEEAYVLSTCNRVEAYVVAADADAGETALEALFAGPREETVVRTAHEESLRHLLRVAAGLESVVVGEDQIIGQVRAAYEDARAAGGVGPTLETAVTKAIRVGERARTETAINEGIVSLGSAAVELLADELDLSTASALVVGAGEMGRLAARSLADAGVAELTVANRTPSRAERVVETLAGDGAPEATAASLEALETVAPRVDVVVSATGSADPVVTTRHVGEREQVVVDLGQPRDVDPAVAARPDVTVYDLDELESITERTYERRSEAAAAVERIVEEEFERLLEQFKRIRADEVIAAMYESAERLKRRELETALSRLEGEDEAFTEDQREIVAAMADALVGQLLAPPTKSLREAAAEDDWETITTALELFDPEFGPESRASALGSAFESGPEPEVVEDD